MIFINGKRILIPFVFFLYGLFIVIVRWMNSVSKDGEELLDLDSYVKVVCSSYVVM